MAFPGEQRSHKMSFKSDALSALTRTTDLSKEAGVLSLYNI
jgi:hypothetical protein